MEYVYFYSVACYITKVFFQKKHKQYKKPVFFCFFFFGYVFRSMPVELVHVHEEYMYVSEC